jgi:hypothetical protein
MTLWTDDRVFDGDELVAAHRFTRPELRQRRLARGHLGRLDSIEHLLVESRLEIED